jgi:TolB-like protein/Flp pilus assembly protein TadD
MQAAGGQSTSRAVAPTEVRAELAKLLASHPLERSPQLQRLLRFVVEETLAGRGDRLKEYVLGVEIFGRPTSYDPRQDSLVRVEAHRLRGILDAYYQAEGSQDSILITLARGTYVPSFSCRQVPGPPQTSAIVPRHSLRKWIWPAAVAIAAFLAATAYWFSRAKVLRPPGSITLAVLPFQNLAPDQESDYFCFGLMDEITTDLARLHNVRVVARTSASRFKQGDDIAVIATQLHANMIVEGSVTQSNGRVRVNAQLINSADGLHLWAETYERPAKDLFQVQDEIAHVIANAVAARLPGNQAHPDRHVTYDPDPEAKQLYWKALYFRAQRGRENLKKSAAYLERAAEKDQRFASAYSALSEVYASLGYESNGNPATAEYMSRSRRAALRALELDDSLAEAFSSLAVVQYFYDWDRLAAEKNFRRALELNPSFAKAHSWYALALVPQRRFDEARAQAQQARDLDPLSNLASNYLGIVAFCSRDFTATTRHAREVLNLDSTFAPAHALLGMADSEQQRWADAIAEYRTGLRMLPGHSFIMGRLGHAYAKSGNADAASALLRDLLARQGDGSVSDIHIAYIYMGLGDRNRALDCLESAYRRRDPDLPYIKVDPLFDPVGKDPRFASLINKMGSSL